MRKARRVGTRPTPTLGLFSVGATLVVALVADVGFFERFVK